MIKIVVASNEFKEALEKFGAELRANSADSNLRYWTKDGRVVEYYLPKLEDYELAVGATHDEVNTKL